MIDPRDCQHSFWYDGADCGCRPTCEHCDITDLEWESLRETMHRCSNCGVPTGRRHPTIPEGYGEIYTCSAACDGLVGAALTEAIMRYLES